MTDRWYYMHAGQTLGPVTAEQLRQLASAGQLEAADHIWPEGKDCTQAIEAQAAVNFSTLAVVPPAAPDWLDDVRASAEAKPPAAPVPTPPAPTDWLDDVRQAEEVEQEFLTIPWDADADATEEEIANELLDEGEDEEEGEEVAEPAPMTEFIPEPSVTCRLVIGSASSRGRVRHRNEDSFLVQQCTWSNLDQRHDVALVVVADGMGGHNAGDRASALVVRALGGVLTPLLTAALSEPFSQPSADDLTQALDRGLREANNLVRQTAQDNADCKGMGSTAVALLIWDGSAHVGLVGDCRVYHWRGGQLTQVTRDQTLVARMVELGQLTPQEAAKHPRRNEVSQAVGKYALIEPAHYDLPLSPGDWLIANCDGLQAHVGDLMLQKMFSSAGPSAAELAHHLVELADHGGGSDNCTVVAVRCL